MKKLLFSVLLASVLLATSLVTTAATMGLDTPAAATSPLSTASPMSQLPARKFVGFYVPHAPTQMAPLRTVESKVGYGATFTNYFQNVCDNGFMDGAAYNVAGRGTIPLLTLEFRNTSSGVSQPGFSLKKIANGSCDAYLKTFAHDAANLKDPAGHPYTIWLRPLHEMNGNWYPWCGTVNGNSPADFVPAWKHIHDVFAAQGATNVKFVWCPNVESLDAGNHVNTDANSISKYWPGDAYVDYMSLDGYNWGAGSGLKWRTFSSLYQGPYGVLAGLSDKPILIAEMGCAPTGGNKAAWIRDAFRVIPTSFPRIVGVGWFNSNGPHRDWRLDSTAASLAAFRSATQNSTWSDRPATSLTIRRSVGRVKRGRALYVSGKLSPGHAGDRVRVYVHRKGSRWAAAWATCDANGAWRYRSKPSKRGSYYYYAQFSTTSSRWGSTSRTVGVSVR